MKADDVKRLEEIFKVVLELEEGRDVTSITQKDTERWDSLAQTSLIAALESDFDITLDIADMKAIISFKSALKVLREKIGQ